MGTLLITTACVLAGGSNSSSFSDDGMAIPNKRLADWEQHGEHADLSSELSAAVGLRDRWQRIQRRRTTLASRAAGFSAEDVASYQAQQRDTQDQQQRSATVVQAVSVARRQLPKPGTCPGGRWPTRRRLLLHTAAGPHARAEAEEVERKRWIEEVLRILTKAQAPIVLESNTLASGGSVLQHIGHGLRSRAIRKRVKDWQRIRKLLLTTYDTPWPKTAAQFLDCVRTLELASQVNGAVMSLAYLENAGGTNVWEAIHLHPLVKGGIKELKLSKMAKHECRTPKQANPVCLSMLAARETLVRDLTIPIYLRMYSWWTLVK
eukprot:6182034-Amphidinium_carterae.1